MFTTWTKINHSKTKNKNKNIEIIVPNDFEHE